jgi:hypothetical protein
MDNRVGEGQDGVAATYCINYCVACVPYLQNTVASIMVLYLPAHQASFHQPGLNPHILNMFHICPQINLSCIDCVGGRISYCEALAQR